MTEMVMVTKGGGCGGGGGGGGVKGGIRATKGSSEEEEQTQLSMVAVLLAAIRKSLVSCRIEESEDRHMIPAVNHMEIGWPTNVQHITHVTFDRFNGFLGLPVEFEVEIPCRVPSASASVFGVSAESMQCCYDSRGNSVPTILLLMQERLYSQSGLKAEGIFRINPENGQEEHVRDQLNKGIVPDNIDVHCLAGLIKAWFRELPSGVLDGLSPEEVLQCNTEEESVELVKQLKPTEGALLNWAVNLMADVVQEEESNKMNARNIAMVFSPNMTQMSDPLTALMHAVQVMNLLKTLITKTLREREETASGGYSPMSYRSSSGQHTDDDFDSQQEMDTSCELRQEPSDYEDHARDSIGSEDGDDDDEEDEEIESLTEIEERFLRQLHENTNVTSTFSDQPANDSSRDHSSHGSCSEFKLDSGLSFTDSKYENSSSATSDEVDSRETMTSAGDKVDKRSASKECMETEFAHMIDKLMESRPPTQPFVSVESA